jgi:DNA-binding CsgD family transcriptional regulator
MAVSHNVWSENEERSLAALSPREREVLERASRGRTNAQMAAELQISTHAVKFHLSSIYRKLHVANRTEAAARYISAVAREETAPRS